MSNYGPAILASVRWAPLVETIVVAGLDLTGAAMRAQVRLYPDAPGNPIVDLAAVTTVHQQGLRLAGVDSGGAVPVSTVELYIDKAAMATMPTAPEIGDDAMLAWDFHVTPPGGVEQRLAFGSFIVQAGVTR